MTLKLFCFIFITFLSFPNLKQLQEMKSGNSFYQTDYHTWVTFILGISIKYVNRLSATSRGSFHKAKKGPKVTQEIQTQNRGKFT